MDMRTTTSLEASQVNQRHDLIRVVTRSITLTDGSEVFDVYLIGPDGFIKLPACSPDDAVSVADKIRAAISAHTLALFV